MTQFRKLGNCVQLNGPCLLSGANTVRRGRLTLKALKKGCAVGPLVHLSVTVWEAIDLACGGDCIIHIAFQVVCESLYACPLWQL